MTDATELQRLLDAQPAFANHFGNVQGGFGVAMIDALVSVAVYAKLRQWCPTVEIKSSFVAPCTLGECRGEARVIKAGKALVFVEARLRGRTVSWRSMRRRPSARRAERLPDNLRQT